MYDPNDIQGFAAGIEYIFEHKNLRDQMSSTNLKNIQRFDCKVINESMKKVDTMV